MTESELKYLEHLNLIGYTKEHVDNNLVSYYEDNLYDKRSKYIDDGYVCNIDLPCLSDY